MLKKDIVCNKKLISVIFLQIAYNAIGAKNKGNFVTSLYLLRIFSLIQVQSSPKLPKSRLKSKSNYQFLVDNTHSQICLS